MARNPKSTTPATKSRSRGRRRPPKNETSREKFVRIGTRRMRVLLHQIQLLGNLAASHYEVHPEDVDKMRMEIDHAVNVSFGRFERSPQIQHENFSFESNTPKSRETT